MSRKLNKKLISIAAIITILIAFYLHPNQYILARNTQINWIIKLQTQNGAIRDSNVPARYDPLQYKIHHILQI